MRNYFRNDNRRTEEAEESKCSVSSLKSMDGKLKTAEETCRDGIFRLRASGYRCKFISRLEKKRYKDQMLLMQENCSLLQRVEKL